MTTLGIEWRKTSSTTTWWLIGLCGLAFVALIGTVVATNITSAAPEDMLVTVGGQTHLVDTPLQYLYSFAGRSGYMFPFLFGALLATNEYRHHTISRSLLMSRSRWSYYTGKISIGVLVGVAYGVLCAAVGGATTALVLSSRGFATDLGSAAVQGILLRTLLAYGLWALLGVGLGSLVRNQVVTIVVVFVFTLFIEPTLTSLGNEQASLNAVLKYFPGAASLSLVWPPMGDSNRGMGLALESLGWWQGGLVLFGYAAVLATAGYLVALRRRDIV